MRKENNITAVSTPLKNGVLLAEIARALVWNPRQVYIEELDQDDLVILTIHAAPRDRGALIGRSGGVIKSIRRLFSQIGRRDGKSIKIAISEG